MKKDIESTMENTMEKVKEQKLFALQVMLQNPEFMKLNGEPHLKNY